MSKRLETFETLISKGSDDPFVHYARAMELRALGRLEEALVAYAAVAERYPSYVPTYLMAGQVAQMVERRDEAAAWLERGVVAAVAAGDAHAKGELEAALADLDAP